MRARGPASWGRPGRVVLNCLISAVVLLVLVVPVKDSSGDLSWPGVVATGCAAVAIWWRDRWPTVVLVICTLTTVVSVFTTPLGPMVVVPLAVSMFSFAKASSRGQALPIAAAIGVVLIPGCVLLASRTFVLPLVVATGVSVCLAAALGDNSRTRAAYIAEITARAERAERTRETEAARRVADERLRIAQDLHDVVAHQLTVISLSAGAASSQLAKDPQAAAASLSSVRGAARRALGDIGSYLAVLRQPEQSPQPLPLRLDQLDELVTEFAASGLRVEATVEGDLPDLSPGTAVVAERVLREALTNALRHGRGGRAQLTVRGCRDRVRLEVVNPIGVAALGQPAAAGSHGLQGIRERAASVRGTVEVNRAVGEFRLAVTLPGGDPA